MEFDQIKELIKLVQGSNLGEFKYEKGDVKISIRTNKSFEKTKEVGLDLDGFFN